MFLSETTASVCLQLKSLNWITTIINALPRKVSFHGSAAICNPKVNSACASGVAIARFLGIEAAPAVRCRFAAKSVFLCAEAADSLRDMPAHYNPAPCDSSTLPARSCRRTTITLRLWIAWTAMRSSTARSNAPEMRKCPGSEVSAGARKVTVWGM